MDCFFCCMVPVPSSLANERANEQAKPLKEDRVSTLAHHSRNDGVKTGLEGREMR